MTTSQHSASPSPAPDVRRLGLQLATLLAGIQDLRQEWQATVELALHLRVQRQQHDQPADTSAVIARDSGNAQHSVGRERYLVRVGVLGCCLERGPVVVGHEFLEVGNYRPGDFGAALPVGEEITDHAVDECRLDEVTDVRRRGDGGLNGRPATGVKMRE